MVNRQSDVGGRVNYCTRSLQPARAAWLDASDYRRWQELVREAQTKRVAIRRPDYAGESFTIHKFGQTIGEFATLDELEHALHRM